jgi:hypothetical protein
MQSGKSSSPTTLFGELTGIAQAVGYDTSILTNPFGFNVFGKSQERNIDFAYRTTLKEPFPINIADVPLSWGDDGYGKLTIQFAYRYFEEEHAKFPDATPNGSLANMLRGGINTLNRFAPAFSLIKGQGLGGALSAAGSQLMSGGRNTIVAQKTIFPF